MSERFAPSPRDLETLRTLDAIVGGVVGRADLARHLGLSTAGLCRWWSDERPMPATGLLAIGRRVAVGSRRDAARLLDEFAHAMGLPGRWVTDEAPPARSVVEELLDTVGHAGRLTSIVHQALGDGTLDRDERVQIVAQIDRLERELAELRTAVGR